MGRRLGNSLFLTVLLSAAVSLQAQVDPLELLKKFNEPEAPPALMTMDINNTAVELFLQGSWKSYIGDYLGFGAVNGASVSMSGFNHTPWSNSVDFLLSLWIQRHYFFETTLSDGFNFRSFSLGYASIDGPGLNKLMVSNTNVDIPAYPYVGLGKAGNDVPGILAEWSTSLSKHTAMLRLLNRNSVTQYFKGTAALLTSKTNTNAFIQGRFFQLPYTNLSAIHVWVQTSTGSLASDGNHYSLLGAQDILYMDMTRGSFGLVVAASTRVLVAWATTSSSQAVDFPDLSVSNQINSASVPFDPSAGSSFETNVTDILASKYGYIAVLPTSSFPSCDAAGLISTVDGMEALLVHSPGLFSVFQDYSWYVRPQGLTPSGASLDTGDDPGLNTNVMADAIHLGYIGASGIKTRYPLLASAYADRFRLYLPGYQPGAEQYLAWKGTGAASQTGIVLDQDALPQSIVVTRNGQPETGFTYGTGSKTLSFIIPVQSSEVITVSYDLASRIGGTRTLQFAQGNTWTPSEDIKVDAAFGLDWPVEPQSTGGSGTDIGRLMTGSSINFKLPDAKLSGELALGGSLNVPGANGARMLQNFSTGYLDVTLGSGMELPGAMPNVNLITATTPFFFGDTPSAIGILLQSDRGWLIYKNYNNGNGGLTAWNQGAQTVYPYSSGNPTGPYLAGTASDDPFAGTVVVADIDLQNSQTWAAFEIRLTTDQRQALAKTGTIWFYLRSDTWSGDPVDIYLQAGRLAEDIDGNGSLDQGNIGTAGFPFHDQAIGGQTLIAGSDSGTSAILSEDSDSNKVLDPDTSPYTRYIGNFTVASHPGWNLVNLAIDESDRIKLQSGTAIRFFVRRTTTSMLTSGKILVGGLHFDLPGMTVASTGLIDTAHASIDRDLSRQISLAACFSEAVQATDSAAQGRVDWSASGIGTVTATQVVDGGSFYDNRYVRLYLQPNQLSAGVFPVRLVMDDGDDNQDNTVSSPSFDLNSSYNSQWLRAEFDMMNNQFTLIDKAGTVIQQGAAQITGHPHLVRHVSLVVTTPSAPSSSGTVFIDSIVASQGIPSLQGNVRGKLDWAYPENLLQTNGYAILGNVRTSQSAEYTGSSRLSNFVGLDDPAGSSINYEGTLGATISYVDILVGTRLLGAKDGLSGQASYQVELPSGIKSPVLLKDSFSTDLGVATPFVQKQTSLGLTFPSIVDLQLATIVNQADNLMRQQWTAELGLGSVSTVHGLSKFDLNQSVRHILIQSDWNSSALTDKLGNAYVWYVPGSEADRLQRSFKWNLEGNVESNAVGLGLSALFSTLHDPTAVSSFTDGLDLKTVLRLGETNKGVSVSFNYLRHSLLLDSFESHSFSDEFTQGLTWLGQFHPSWLVVPFYELFDNGATFIQESSPYQNALVRPQFGVGISRPLDSQWTALLLPKQLDTGIARLLERKGVLINDRFIYYGSVSWNAMNQFGRIGQAPTFKFYDTDQLDYRISGGVLLHDAHVEQWEIAPSLSVALFGMAIDSGKNEWRSRSASSMGLIELVPPNQFRLGDTFVYRGGIRSLIANSARLEYSWYSDFPDIKYDFLNKKSQEVSFLESTETIEVKTNYPQTDSATSDSVGTSLNDLYGFPDNTSGDTGLTLSFSHKSYLILPGLAYLSAQLSIGYHQDMVTLAGTIAVQLYIEARVVF